MNSSRRKLAALLEALGVPPSARRPAAPPASPACESLEGRQLLAGGLGMTSMGLGAGMGGIADVSNSGSGFGSDSSNLSGIPRFSQGSGVQGVWGSPGVGLGGGLDGNSGGDLGVPGLIGVSQVGGMGIPSMGQGGVSGVSAAGGGFGQDFSMMPFDRFGGGGDFGGQGSMVPGQGMGAGSGTSSAPTADQAQLQTDLQKFQTDSQAIHDKSQVTPAMEATVRNDIKAIKGAETTTPDQAAVTTLQTDIKTTRASTGGPTDAQIAQIQTDQDAIYKSQGVNAALISKLDTDQAAIKTASGVTDADKATLVADQAAIKADFAKIAPPSTTSTGTDSSTTPAPIPTATASTTTQAATPDVTGSTTATASSPTTPTTPPSTPPSTPPATLTPPSPPATPMAIPAMDGHLARAVHGHAGHLGRMSHRRG